MTNKELVAVLLNFVLPGSGLLYLGRPLEALANFAVALAIPVMWLMLPDGLESIHYALLVVSAGSAGYAHAAAAQQVKGV